MENKTQVEINTHDSGKSSLYTDYLEAKLGFRNHWYHGFTFNLETGVLCDIIANPKSNMIGRLRIDTFPVIETRGLIFVFMGD